MEPLVLRLFDGDRDFTLNKLSDVIGGRSGSLTAGSLIHHVVQSDLPTQRVWARHGNSPTDVLQISVKGPLLECSLEDFEPFPDTIQEVRRILGSHGPAAEVHLTQNLLKYELFRRPEIVFLKDVVSGKSDSSLQEPDAQHLNPFYDEKLEELNLEMHQNLAYQLITGSDFAQLGFSHAQQGEICTKGGKLKRNGEEVLDLRFCTIFHSCSAQSFQIVLVGCWNKTISIWLEDRSHFNCWLSGLRLMKFGSKLRSCFCCRTDDKEGSEQKDDPFKKSENFLSRLGKLKLSAVSSKCCSASLASSRQSSKSSFLSSSVPTSLSSGSSSSRRVSLLESRSPIIHDNDDEDNQEEDEEEYGIADDIFAAVYRSEGEFKIVTDPARVEEIKKEEMMRRRRSGLLQQQLSKEPWYSVATADAIGNVLRRHASVDGVFLVRSSNFHSSDHPDLDTFALMLMAEEKMSLFRILQKPMFGKTVFTLDNGQTNFPTVASLIEFYQHNKGILPCLLTEYPRL